MMIEDQVRKQSTGLVVCSHIVFNFPLIIFYVLVLIDAYLDTLSLELDVGPGLQSLEIRLR